MNYLDWIVIAIYIGFLIGLSAYLSRGQRSIEDYYFRRENCALVGNRGLYNGHSVRGN